MTPPANAIALRLFEQHRDLLARATRACATREYFSPFPETPDRYPDSAAALARGQATYEALLGHRGIRGLVVCCEDCKQDHYHDWDMLRANLLQLLVDGTVRPHEPAYDPMPESYVTWDYCRGYADASMNEALHGDGGFDT